MKTIVMGIVNLTPDSFFAPSRVTERDFMERVRALVSQGAEIIDLGAVSTRPGASDVSAEEEWKRLEGPLNMLASCPDRSYKISVDTTSAEIVRRCHDLIGDFIVNDISAGEDDPKMLSAVGNLGLKYIAMHKRGNPRTMDSATDYPEGVVAELLNYFTEFDAKAADAGIKDWILDPGLGFAKTEEQNWEIVRNIACLASFGRPILIGAADKRFTHGDTERVHRTCLENLKGSESTLILRVHDVEAAVRTVRQSLV